MCRDILQTCTTRRHFDLIAVLGLEILASPPFEDPQAPKFLLDFFRIWVS